MVSAPTPVRAREVRATGTLRSLQILKHELRFSHHFGSKWLLAPFWSRNHLTLLEFCAIKVGLGTSFAGESV